MGYGNVLDQACQYIDIYVYFELHRYTMLHQYAGVFRRVENVPRRFGFFLVVRVFSRMSPEKEGGDRSSWLRVFHRASTQARKHARE